ncbi:serine/threonine-protein kinase PCRK1 [Heracleum sosnowskyi]|uniref:non-specific serine/threonine protein kinase n=1 Tax=Heracleum sosnowskyi TaxID=360622 RepID=A0AAD8IP58_9APIA|nr:serine/threonine-protein kinase PCRK1 [Heracleum sosnowskyi]
MECFPFNIRKGKDDTKPSEPASFQSSGNVFTDRGTGKSGSEFNSWNVSDSSTNSGRNRNTFSGFSQQSSNLRAFTFADLRLVTKNFSRSTKIGEGGFGCVYRGVVKISEDPKKLDVAVKQLGKTGFQGHKEWITEVNVLGVVEHPNLVKLVGYCAEDDERGIQRLLVYEFMPNGSVHDHLSTRSQNPLSWEMRLKVAQDTARGLAYLHEDMDFQIIFRDFKSSNILLDEQWNAKLSDFGLARLGPEEGLTHVSTAVVGTMGYAAPEYIQTGRLTSKNDVWSYGVFLYELITGRQPIDRNRPKSEQKLLEWVRPYLSNPKKFRVIIDPRFEGKYPIKSALKLSKIANQCLARNPKTRPKMSEVLELVNQIIDPLAKAEGTKPERALSVPQATPKEVAHQRSTEQTGRIRQMSKYYNGSWLARIWSSKLVKTS